MNKINRKNLVENLNKVNEKLDEAKKIKFEYKTGDRYLTGWAVIKNITNLKELLEILTYLKGQMVNTTDAAKDLGIDLSELEGIEDNIPTLCGYKVTEWIDDVKTRKAELDNIALINKLNKAKSLLEANLSEDDKFELDMQRAMDLLN